jgi:hypothetical protein
LWESKVLFMATSAGSSFSGSWWVLVLLLRRGVGIGIEFGGIGGVRELLSYT